MKDYGKSNWRDFFFPDDCLLSKKYLSVFLKETEDPPAKSTFYRQRLLERKSQSSHVEIDILLAYYILIKLKKT